ncbi:uncharacterized protein CLUP02_08672 [Colletotrichum lupini]|uniref:Uncharacterized protein n=1 Tax=Colletotrichum lupini TaxID=145971 RepID=A0A9Q8STZ1_9PEZI|nr:uncharacterized protein CLUP02_08672 [Colletotrichum lupini]UQC83178.1 hypothetical protein CLUP02_08672 [Colletotrichum lupini]
MRTSTLFNALSGAAVVAAGVLAMDLGDEMRMGWKYGLLPRQTTQNLQTFEGNLGGVQAENRDPQGGSKRLAPGRGSVWRSMGGAVSGITKSNYPSRPFEVDGDTFVSFFRLIPDPDFNTAAGRSCDNQKNKCSQAANNGPQKFEVTKCDEQAEQCKNTIDTITKQSFSDPVWSSDMLVVGGRGDDGIAVLRGYVNGVTSACVY